MQKLKVTASALLILKFFLKKFALIKLFKLQHNNQLIYYI